MIPNAALILVDIQNDFLPGGALAVSEGDEIIPVANQLMPLFSLVVASQDWHPADHASFASQHKDKRVGDVVMLQDKPQILWPDHCVQHSTGAQLAADLDHKKIHYIIPKGCSREVDSYSAFFDNYRLNKTQLHELLQAHHIKSVYIMGLATDYCVKFTALDALSLGYTTYVVVDGCRGVNIQPQDSEAALKTLQREGAKLVFSQDLINKESKAN